MVKVCYKRESFNQLNDASEGWQSYEETVSIDDGGVALGNLLVGLLAWGAKNISVNHQP